MAAARARWRFLALPLALLLAIGSPRGLDAAPKPPVPKAISDLREAIVKGLGFQSEELKVSGFDVRDALVGHAVAYEFDMEVGRKVVPVRLLEDVNRWDFVDLPIFRSQADADDTALAEIGRGSFDPTLPPFQLAGPMELWIQDGDDVRLALPHDVEAGTLKKVVLADGAVVTVKGARAVSLRLPLELPLPLNRTTYKGRLSSLLSIARALRGAARSNQKPLMSLRIEGPTSLSSTPSMSPNDKLKLKRLAPGQVELSSRAIPAVTDDEDESPSPALWPFLSLNASDGSLQGLEELLAKVLGKKAGEKGTFKLVNARASAQTYVKMGFTVEKQIADGEVNWSNLPEWKTKPKKLRAHYEVLARVERGQAIPERIAQVQPFQVDEAMSESMLTGNVSTQLPQVSGRVPLARSNLRPCEQRSARNQGPAGAPRRRCLGHAHASFSFPRSLSISQILSFSLCPVGCHGYSSWPPFAASSSGSSGRRRWPLCLEPLHLLHRAGALARAQAPDRRPRVSLPDPAAVGTPGTARAMDRSESLPWSSATGRIQCSEGQIRPSATALARIPSSLPASTSPPSLAVLYVFTPWKPASLFPR